MKVRIKFIIFGLCVPCLGLFLTFLFLQLVGVIDWDWWKVALPLISLLGLVLACCSGFAFYNLCYNLWLAEQKKNTLNARAAIANVLSGESQTVTKAFTPYPKNEVVLRKVLRKLQDIGTLNCDFVAFNSLFLAWHERVFPRERWEKATPHIPYNADPKTSLLFRQDWFYDFIGFISNATLHADGSITVLTDTGSITIPSKKQ